MPAGAGENTRRRISIHKRIGGPSAHRTAGTGRRWYRSPIVVAPGRAKRRPRHRPVGDGTAWRQRVN